MSCAVYVRVSTEMETQKTSIAHQINFFQSYIQKKGWQLYCIYKDFESGRSIENREGLQALLKDAGDSKFNTILTKSISRFARNTLEGLSMVRDFKFNDIRFISIEDGFDSEEYDEFMLTLLLSLAQKESEKISERVKFGKWCRAKLGFYNGGHPPYGYKKGDKDSLIPADDISVYIVQKIFNMYIEGYGFYKIAQELNRQGYPTPSQTAEKCNSSPIWHQSTIRNILTNPVYIGDLVQNKTGILNSIAGKRQKNHESLWIHSKSAHPGIIDIQVFEEAQRLLQKKSRKNITVSKNPFSGLLICGECGSNMHYKKGKKAYICGKLNKMGKEYCPGSYIREEDLNKIIKEDLKKSIDVQISEQSILEKVRLKRKEGKQIKNIELNHARCLNELYRKKERLAELWMRGNIDEGIYIEKLKEINGQEELIKKKQKESKQKNQSQEIELEPKIKKILRTEILNSIFLQRLIEEIIVFKDKELQIKYSFGELTEMYEKNDTMY